MATTTINITIINGSTTFERTLNVKNLKNQSELLGTTLNDFFTLVNMQADKHIKLFKFNQPFDLIIKTDKIQINTTKISTSLKSCFKLNKTAKRKRKFAQAVNTLVTFVTSETTVKTIEQVISELNH